MEKVVLQATKRNVTGRKVGALRREGKLPAVMYGSKFESVPILLDLHDATLALRNVSSSTIVYINLDGKEFATLVQDKQRNYIMGSLMHLDFRVVDMNVAVNVMVPIELVGEAPAIHSMGGMLMHEMIEVEVQALPGDLPESFQVDLSTLVDYDARITVADLTVGSMVTVLTDPEHIIAFVAPLAEEEEAEEVEEELFAEESTEPEVIEKGKKEEEVE
ncbi:MAG: 50S ribosomal protein L25 [Anaerolineae bacterium]|nr:50S ribosomal protein L25 [Anaerolineae bacterium]